MRHTHHTRQMGLRFSGVDDVPGHWFSELSVISHELFGKSEVIVYANSVGDRELSGGCGGIDDGTLSLLLLLLPIQGHIPKYHE